MILLWAVVVLQIAALAALAYGWLWLSKAFDSHVRNHTAYYVPTVTTVPTVTAYAPPPQAVTYTAPGQKVDVQPAPAKPAKKKRIRR